MYVLPTDVDPDAHSLSLSLRIQAGNLIIVYAGLLIISWCFNWILRYYTEQFPRVRDLYLMSHHCVCIMGSLQM